MGYVYVGKGENDNHFKIGRATLAEVRLKSHRMANPSMQFHIVEPCESPAKVEAYLKNYFESKRKGGTDEWFDIELSEMPEAMQRAQRYVKDLVELKPEVEMLKSAETCETFLEPLPSDREAYIRLRQIDEAMAKLKYERDQLQWRLKLRIGRDEGIKGIASWLSFSKKRFDLTVFKRENPYLHQAYCTDRIERRFSIY
jgi:hypothetical protein